MGRFLRVSGEDVNSRFTVGDASGRQDVQNRLGAGDRRAHKLAFQIVGAGLFPRIDVPHFAAIPCQEIDLVNRADHGCGRPLVPHQPRKGGGKCAETVHKLGLENVDVIRPAIVTQIPDHFRAGAPGCVQHGEEGRPVILAWSVLDQVPAQSVADRADAQRLQRTVVRFGEFIMPSGAEDIQPAAVFASMARTFEPGHEEALEKRVVRRLHSHYDGAAPWEFRSDVTGCYFSTLVGLLRSVCG